MYNAYPSVASTSLSASGSIAEEYIPLWVYSSGATSGSSSARNFLQKGSASTTTTASSSTQLHTLSSNWSPNQKFALEVSIYSGTSGQPIMAALHDFTANSDPNGFNIITSATTATLLRTGAYSLIPGHVYGVYINEQGTGVAYLTKAHLVALEM